MSRLLTTLFSSNRITRVLSPGLSPGDRASFVTKLRLGAWYVLEADPALALRKPDGLWEELVQSVQRAEKSI